MNILKRVLFSSLVYLSLVPSVWANDEVSVLSVMNVPMSKYGMSWQTPQLRLRVKNLAFDKDVKVVFKDGAGNETISEASYFGPADSGYEVWEVFSNVRTGQPQTFHVEYSTQLESFQIEDLELKIGPVLYAGQNIQQVLSGQQFYGAYANFVVAVRNLAYHKNVVAHYSCDNFQSKKSVALSFQPYFSYGYGTISSPTPEGFEMWSGSIGDIAESCSVIRYYFTYDVKGQRYADTNFGHNYTMVRN